MSEERTPRPHPGYPTPGGLAERADFDKLVTDSLAATRKSAESWRAGLAALVTLVTSALLLSGPDKVSDMPWGYGLLVTVPLLAGLVVAAVGLWWALEAAAGDPEALKYDDLIAQHGSVRGWQVAAAKRAAGQLDTARKCIAVALGLFVVGMAAWWWSPTTDPAPTTYKVTTAKAVYCGEIKSSDHGVLRIRADSHAQLEQVRLRDVTGIEESDC